MWYNLNFYKQNVEYETEKSVLIKMPNNSNYKGFKFWHPKKLVRTIGGKGYFLSFSFNENFDFNLFKKNNEISIGYEEMLIAWEEISEKIDSYNDKNDTAYLSVEEPRPIDEEIKQIPELER